MDRNRSRNAKSLAETIAAFCRGLNLAEVPSSVVAHAKLLFLDTLGAALAGVRTQEGERMISAACHFAAASGPCAIWGTGRRTTPAAAALVNGTLAHAQELDDFGGCDHSGAVVIPAVLAAAEGRDVSGTRVLEAIIAGYDVAFRALDAAGGYRAHNGRGWHSTGTCGSFGAAAGVAKILGLSAEQTAWAIGLGGTFTGGTWAFLADGAMSKRYHPGRAAETGVVAGFLAREGFTGPTRVFEADWGGFLPTYAAGDAHPERLVEGLGAEFKIMRSGVKPYACCRDIHSTLDAILALRRRERLDAGNVKRLRVQCTPQRMRMLGDVNPQTRLAAQMSLPYSVAVALVAGRASLAEYEDRWLEDARVREFMSRVEMVLEPALPEGAEPHVTVTTRDGRTFSDSVACARGAPENPLSEREVVEKFEALATRALSPTEARTLHHAVFALEEPGSLARLMAALSAGGTEQPGEGCPQ